MAQKKSNKRLSTSYHVFKGVDARESHSGKESIYELKNFKVLPDGSIQRRIGYKTFYTADSDIRTVWSGYVDGYSGCYFIAGNKVYQVYEALNSAGAFSTISTSYGKAEFFLLKNLLHIIDGKNIYKIKNALVSPVIGYVPLFGKDWPVGKIGEINEPLNLLNRHARITYVAGTSPSSYLATIYPVESVEAVYKNGEAVSINDFTIDSKLNSINLKGIESGDSIEVNLTFAPRTVDERNTLLSCTSATVFGGINNSRLFMWNGNKKNMMFASRYVSDEAIAEAEKRYADCGGIYFPEGNSFTVGKGGAPVKAVTKHYDRLIILTSEDAWMANNSTCDIEPFPIMNINSNIGCAVNHGAVTVGNDPISLGEEAVYQWTSDTDELNEANAYSISGPISKFFSKYYLSNAIIFADKENRQIWLTSASERGLVWIYDVAKKIWFSYDNIEADMFFKMNGNVGFINKKDFCIFYEDLTRDFGAVGDSEGEEIVATMQSGILDFETPRAKKLSALVIKGDISDSDTDLEFVCDGGEKINISLNSEADPHSIITKRLFSHRFKSLYFKLTAKGNSRQTIHSLYIDAR